MKIDIEKGNNYKRQLRTLENSTLRKKNTLSRAITEYFCTLAHICI